MELPDRIDDMNPAQMNHFEMLVDQYDAKYPRAESDEDREERLAKDPHLAILPSGMKLSTASVRSFELLTPRVLGMIAVGDLPDFWKTGDGLVTYTNGATVLVRDPHDIAAFNSALNDIGVYVNAPTLKGDDADGDGEIGEHHLNAILGPL